MSTNTAVMDEINEYIANVEQRLALAKEALALVKRLDEIDDVLKATKPVPYNPSTKFRLTSRTGGEDHVVTVTKDGDDFKVSCTCPAGTRGFFMCWAEKGILAIAQRMNSIYLTGLVHGWFYDDKGIYQKWDFVSDGR
jgi:hypothetical protein